jgi:3-hydroxymyristoyl/3-hydroxydecanoyl-(acyl carrier protein) dehydratase
MSSSKEVLKNSVFYGDDSRYFDGHFPGLRILPAMAQLDQVHELILKKFGGTSKIVSLHRVKFLSIVKPGTHLDVEVSIAGHRFTFQVLNAGSVVGKGSGTYS